MRVILFRNTDIRPKGHTRRTFINSVLLTEYNIIYSLDFKAKVERTRLEGDQDSIEQFPASKGMLVTGVSDAEENVEGQSHFARNKLLVRGLSQLTTRDGLVYFIEAMSGGEEVKEVLMLKNGSALVTMAVDIKSKSTKLRSHFSGFPERKAR